MRAFTGESSLSLPFLKQSVGALACAKKDEPESR